MEKKVYSKPVLEFECFLPNHYCNVCFDLHCNIPWDNPDPDHHEDGLEACGLDSHNHRHKKYTNGTGCGWDNNQVIRIDDNEKVSVAEINVPTHTGRYECSFQTPADLDLDWLRDHKDDQATRITWTTTVGNTTYYHSGWAIWHDPTKDPNHS